MLLQLGQPFSPHWHSPKNIDTEILKILNIDIVEKVNLKNIDIYDNIDMAILENINIDKGILENIDTDKGILENNDLDKWILSQY